MTNHGPMLVESGRECQGAFEPADLSGPLPSDRVPFMNSNRVPELDPVIKVVLQRDPVAAQKELLAIERSSAAELPKAAAKQLAATLEDTPKPSPNSAPPTVTGVGAGRCETRHG